MLVGVVKFTPKEIPMTRSFVFVLLFALNVANASPCAPEGTTAEGSEKELTVTATSMDVSEAGSRRLVTTLGTINNPSTACFDEVVLELSYFDKAGNLVDTTTQELRAVIALPKTSVNFRMVESVTKPNELYASQKARVISAENRYSRKSKQKESLFQTLLTSFGPMILLILVWIVLQRKYSGKKSQLHQAIEKQVALGEAQLKVLERMAAALEARQNGSRD
jgi:hypothetical protein